MKKLKRNLCLLLSILLVASSLVFNVSAEERSADVPEFFEIHGTEELCGTEQNYTRLILNEDGKYRVTKTLSGNQYYYFYVVVDGKNIGYNDKSYSFRTAADGDVTIVFDYEKLRCSVESDVVKKNEIECVTAKGYSQSRDPAYLNGVNNDYSPSNDLTRISDNVYSKTYEKLSGKGWYYLSFFTNTINYNTIGGVFDGFDKETECSQYDVFKFRLPDYDYTDLTITVDLTNYDPVLSIGAVCKISAVQGTAPEPLDIQSVGLSYYYKFQQFSASENEMELGSDGRYSITKTFSEGEIVQFSVIVNDDLVVNNSLESFCMKSDGEVKFVFDPVVQKCSVLSDSVYKSEINDVTVFGHIDSGYDRSKFINGVENDAVDDKNKMTQVSDGVYTLTAKGVRMCTLEIGFAANSSKELCFSGKLEALDEENFADIGKPLACQVELPYLFTDITFTFDITDYDPISKMGAKFKVSVAQGTDPSIPPTEPEPDDIEGFYIVGSEEVCGEEWSNKPWKNGVPMTEVEGSGGRKFTQTFTDVPASDYNYLSNGDTAYEFKVVYVDKNKNITWHPGGYGNNTTVKVPEDGSTIVFTFELLSDSPTSQGSFPEMVKARVILPDGQVYRIISSAVLIGDKELCGSEWDPTDTNNAMTLDEDEKFRITKKVSDGGYHQFRIAVNDGREFDDDDHDYRFKMIGSGDVTFVFDPYTHKCSLEGENIRILGGNYIIIENVFIASDFIDDSYSYHSEEDSRKMIKKDGVFIKSYNNVRTDRTYEIRFYSDHNSGKEWGAQNVDLDGENQADPNYITAELNIPSERFKGAELINLTVVFDMKQYDPKTNLGAKFSFHFTDVPIDDIGEPETKPIETKPIETKPNLYVQDYVNSDPDNQVETFRYYFYISDNLKDDVWNNNRDSYLKITWTEGSYSPFYDYPQKCYCINQTVGDANIYYVDVPTDVPLFDVRFGEAERESFFTYQTYDGGVGYYPEGLENYNNMICVTYPENKDFHSWFYYYGDGKYGYAPTLEQAGDNVYSGGDFPYIDGMVKHGDEVFIDTSSIEDVNNVSLIITGLDPNTGYNHVYSWEHNAVSECEQVSKGLYKFDFGNLYKEQSDRLVIRSGIQYKIAVSIDRSSYISVYNVSPLTFGSECFGDTIQCSLGENNSLSVGWKEHAETYPCLYVVNGDGEVEGEAFGVGVTAESLLGDWVYDDFRWSSESSFKTFDVVEPLAKAFAKFDIDTDKEARRVYDRFIENNKEPSSEVWAQMLEAAQRATLITKPDISYDSTDALIKASDVKARAGGSVEVPISILNNPGITGMALDVYYDDSVLKLVDVKDGELLGKSAHKDKLEFPYKLVWENDTSKSDITNNGVIATLVFKVLKDAQDGDYPIVIGYDFENSAIVNQMTEKVRFNTENASVSVSRDYIIGDVNGDGKVNNLDRACLSRYLAGWKEYEDIIEKSADVNNDGVINTIDRVILSRYLANWKDYPSLPYVSEVS